MSQTSRSTFDPLRLTLRAQPRSGKARIRMLLDKNPAGQKFSSRIKSNDETKSTTATKLLLSGYATPMKRRRLLKAILIIGVVVALLSIYYVKSHPLVFNESLWQHAHCMPQAASSFRMYAADNGGGFPYHTNGYGDALLMMTPERAWFYFLTGPGYDTSALKEALDSGGDVDESRCGRVYVQGLSETNDARIALFFDKVAAPPDHSHFPRRLWRGFVREVCFVDGHWDTVPVERWSAFAQEQIELLVQAGFTRERAEGLYSQAR